MPLLDVEARKRYGREYMKKWYADPENNKRQRQSASRNRKKHRAKCLSLILEFKAKGCVVCGESDPVALDAHHTTDDKLFSIGCFHKYSISKIKNEMKKCVCLCSNCHRKHHAGRLSIPTALS